MITPQQLFVRRLASEWRFQYTAWKSVINLVVAIYFVLPAAFVSVHGYIMLWRQPPAWLGLIPLNWLAAAVFYYAWSGTIRILVEEADQLFLLQRRDWIRRITGLSLCYSTAVNLISSLLLFVLLAPVTFMHHLSWAQTGLFMTIAFLLRTDLSLVKHRIAVQWSGWKRFLLKKTLFLALGVPFVWGIDLILNHLFISLAIIALLLLLSVVLIAARLNQRRTFLSDVAQEMSARLRYASFMLRVSGMTFKKPPVQRRRPRLFPSSNPLFRERNAVSNLTELCIKLFLQNTRNIVIYLVITALCLAFAWPYTAWLKLIFWACYAVMFASWSYFCWQETTSSDFLKLFRWKQSDLSTAARMSIFILMLPGFLSVGLILGFQAFSWAGALAIIPAAIFLGRLATRFVSRFL
jgi:ABC-2 type transport system permease protein